MVFASYLHFMHHLESFLQLYAATSLRLYGCVENFFATSLRLYGSTVKV